MRALRNLFRALVGLLLLTAIAVGATLTYFLIILPSAVPVPAITVERSPERIARGQYLATAVYGCVYCHSERDWTLFGAPPKPGTIGKGGERFDRSVGLSGELTAPNITPYHLGSWSDGEIYRAITSGLHKDGYALFPVMPWDAYIWLETADVYAIIAYLRTLAPIAADWPARKPSMLMRIIANSRVRPAEPWTVNRADPIARGEYIAVIGGCRFCHTPPSRKVRWNVENLEEAFAGGRVIPAAGHPVKSANISPDLETGIGAWTVEQFVARFKAYEGARIPAAELGYNTQHAWTEYAQLTAADLADVYAYLMAQRPIRNELR
jgi:mono/diheme cytochrome c family protein